MQVFGEGAPLRRAWSAIEALSTLVWLVPIVYGVLRWFSVIGGSNVFTVVLIFIGCVGLSLSIMSKRRKKRPRYGDPRKQTPTKSHPAKLSGGAPLGSFVIGGPGQTVEDAVIENSYSNSPDGFGGIYGDVKNSRMSGNVHEPGS
jgi:hypothetical protein